MSELFPTFDRELVALVAYLERGDPYGALRALACAGRRVLGEGGAGAGAGVGGGAGGEEVRWWWPSVSAAMA
ncbi:unnamed protein product [Parnassius apollo]|uniref:(apollo) hypothetical protein n=1 Tax=Parnassius apollo TaxID=110799 RepID=A0A8S3WCQ6_PARAO|nr:unnamed protein product [Parnassius apollo]